MYELNTNHHVYYSNLSFSYPSLTRHIPSHPSFTVQSVTTPPTNSAPVRHPMFTFYPSISCPMDCSFPHTRPFTKIPHHLMSCLHHT